MILTALDAESRAIARRLGLGREAPGLWSGHIHGCDVALRTIGPAAASLGDPGALVGVSAVIVAGLGGGLDPDLRPGHTVVDGLEWVEVPGEVRRGRIHSAAAIVGTPEFKARLRAETAADVVDMEHAIIRRRVPEGVPLIGIRTVLDGADEALPGWLGALVDPAGRARPLAAAQRVLGSPASLGVLLRLSRRTRSVLPLMADAVALATRSLAAGSGAKVPVG